MKTLFLILLMVIPNAEGVLVLTGASSPEDLDESTMERFENLRRNPVPINCCSRSRLLSCGLFTRFQVASLLDYRTTYGDILSFTELAAVDGFGERYAGALKEFVSLEGNAAIPSKHKTRQTLMVRAAIRRPGEEEEFCAGLKYHLESGRMFELNLSDRTTYSSPEPGFGTMNITCYGRKVLGKMILGDYNARFGQGLLVWSGFSMSGVSSAEALVRNGTGLSPSGSFSTSFHGAAVDINAGRQTVSLAYDREGRAFLNANREGKTWQAGISGVFGKGRTAFSSDWRIGFRGGAAYGEVAVDGGSIAIVAGAFFIPRYGSQLSALVRIYPSSYGGITSGAVRSGSKVSDEYGASVAARNNWGLLTVDTAWHPSKDSGYGKALVQLKKVWNAGIFAVSPSLRASGRVTFKKGEESLSWRSDIRADIAVSTGRWSFNGRYNVVGCTGWGWLCYAEAGYLPALAGNLSVSAYLRTEIYRIDNWADRIYVYERDAPGNFNVPAYYGRGWNISLVSTVKFRRHSWSIRACLLKREFKFQYSVSL